ncbi:hypothetical protein PybrP1_003681 [[Pythium] brassicae (nom. inval.)]|nr:hypothetical protein PybrP1_003681 [[Pythium] brassicae (nom. inval.)]
MQECVGGIHVGSECSLTVALVAPKEMLLLAGNKAARNASLASFSALGSGGAARSSNRETPSQRSAVARLKELQTRRASMAAERKKVRNYSSVAT